MCTQAKILRNCCVDIKENLDIYCSKAPESDETLEPGPRPQRADQDSQEPINWWEQPKLLGSFTWLSANLS